MKKKSLYSFAIFCNPVPAVESILAFDKANMYSFAIFCNPPPVVESILAFNKANMYCNKLLNS